MPFALFYSGVFGNLLQLGCTSGLKMKLKHKLQPLKHLMLRNMLNKSQSNNPSVHVTEALHQNDKILPNFYILDSFPPLSLLPKCLERMLLKRGMGNGEWGMGNGEWRMGNGEWGMRNSGQR